MKKRVFFMTALAVAACVGYAGYQMANDKEQPASTEQDVRITLTTQADITRQFTLCGHSMQEEVAPYIGMNKSEFQEAFAGKVTKFSKEEVAAVRVIEQYCPEHHILKADAQGAIFVMRPDRDGNLVIFEETGATLAQVCEEKREKVREGIVLDQPNSLRSMLAYLKE